MKNVKRLNDTNRKDFPIKYIARCGIALFGHSNNETENPFDENFHDNYVEGKGYTKEIAINKMKENYKEIGNSLWF